MPLRLIIIAALFFVSCNTSYYTLTLEDDRFKLRPGENIEKVKYRLSRYQYIYNRDGDTESLQYYCTKCGDKVRLITLKFVNGQLNVIENKTADSIF